MRWDDVPHLTEEQKAELWESIPPHERDARAKGIPVLGVGKVYPISEDDVLCEPFEMPQWWPRAFGLDVGWNKTAAIWGAWDRDSDTVYLYSEYYAGQQPPAVHGSAILTRGDWMAGAVDPASVGANQKDGTRLIDEYRDLGVNVIPADNTVEAGLFACYQRLSTGRLKVFNTLRNWLAEYRIYRRDEKGKVVKENDHLMDAMRYLIMTGMAAGTTPPDEEDRFYDEIAQHGRNETTGY
jgi:hypothetical protein